LRRIETGVKSMAICSPLRVSTNGTIRKERTLSFPGKVLVKVGDLVGPSAIIAKSDYTRGKPRVLDIQAELKRRLTPEMFDEMLLVKPGERVAAGQPVARCEAGVAANESSTEPKAAVEVKSPCDGFVEYMSRLRARVTIREDASSMKPMVVVNVAAILRIHPRWLRSQATVREGDVVTEGQPIAGSAYSGNLELAYAPISGVVTRICPKAGTITIVRPMRLAKVHAYIPGKVVGLVDDMGAVIEGTGSVIQGLFGVGGEVFGPLTVPTHRPEDILDEAGINESCAGKIIACGSMATYAALEKSRWLGAKGLIAGGLNQRDLLRFYGQEINPFNTSAVEASFTVVMLEGAGHMPVQERVWRILRSSSGKMVSMNGTTTMGRDPMRPEVIISDENDLDGKIRESPLEPNSRFIRASIGDRVRCLREPYLGLWGTVLEVPPRQELLECGTYAEVVRVRLDDGRLVTVAEANVEVFLD